MNNDLFDRDLFNYCKNYVDEVWGKKDKVAYQINDNGTRTEIKLGYYILREFQDDVKMLYCATNKEDATSTSYPKKDFNLRGMLEITKPGPNYPTVSHMLLPAIEGYSALVRENAINDLLDG